MAEISADGTASTSEEETESMLPAKMSDAQSPEKIQQNCSRLKRDNEKNCIHRLASFVSRFILNTSVPDLAQTVWKTLKSDFKKHPILTAIPIIPALRLCAITLGAALNVIGKGITLLASPLLSAACSLRILRYALRK